MEGTYTITVGAKGIGHSGNTDGGSGGNSNNFAQNGGNSRFRNTSGGTTIDYTAFGGGAGVSSDGAAGTAGGVM